MFVLSQGDFCSPVRQFCTTWMASCKRTIDVWETSAEIPYWWCVTSQIWIVSRHQYGISALISQTSFRGETSGSVVKCQLFSQASKLRFWSRLCSDKGVPMVRSQKKYIEPWKKRRVSVCLFFIRKDNLTQSLAYILLRLYLGRKDKEELLTQLQRTSVPFMDAISFCRKKSGRHI